MEPTSPAEYGLIGFLLILIWRVMGIGSSLFIAKKNPPPGQTTVGLACQQDPRHFQRIREIHEMTLDTDKKKAAGDFGCAWQGRDEVRDSLELQRQLLKAIQELTAELRLTRNGGSGHK